MTRLGAERLNAVHAMFRTMAVTPVDDKARQILFNTYWTPGGWTSDETVRKTPKADIAYARSKGLMFEPYTASHDKLVADVRAAAAALTLKQVGSAFLASLSTRRPDLRSGLGSYTLAKALAPHRWRDPLNGTWCEECRGLRTYKKEDLNAMSFERHKWGGVRHSDPLYQYLDLTSLARSLPATPTREDRAVFTGILKAIRATPKTDGPSKLSQRLKDVLPSDKNERNTLLEILAIAGVLVAKKERSSPGEWGHVGMWRGEDGYDAKRVKQLFG